MEQAELTLFQHTPLDLAKNQIRLLQVHKRDTDEPIRCTVQIFNRNGSGSGELPPYLALSYEWGSPDGLKTIELNGATFMIRKNLWDFLDHASRAIQADSKVEDTGNWSHRRLSKWWKPYVYRPTAEISKSSEDLWYIDQICIDQQSLVEKNHQLQLMPTIYSGASSVIAWVGAEADAAVTFFTSLRRYPEDGYQDFQLEPQALPGLWFITTRSYWSRLWIVQELLLAQTITIAIGNYTMPAEHLVLHWKDNRPKRSHRIREDPKRYCQILLKHLARKGDNNHQMSYNALDLMLDFRNSICEDPHDRLYAILGLLDEDEIEQYHVDYNQSVQAIFRDVISRSFNHEACHRGLQFRPMHQLRTMMGIGDDFSCAVENCPYEDFPQNLPVQPTHFDESLMPMALIHP